MELRNLAICFIFLSFIFSCQSDNKTMTVFSHSIDDPKEKSDILNRYLINQSGLLGAEYFISYQDNSTGFLAAPSDYYMKFALKIIPDSIDQWILGLNSSKIEINNNMWDNLQLNSSWSFSSIPDYYHSTSNKVIKLVYRKDSIVLAIYASDPLNSSYLPK